jgi:hypothetical protein
LVKETELENLDLYESKEGKGKGKSKGKGKKNACSSLILNVILKAKRQVRISFLIFV